MSSQAQSIIDRQESPSEITEAKVCFDTIRKLSENFGQMIREKRIEEKFAEEIVRNSLAYYCEGEELKVKFSPVSKYDSMEVLLEGVLYEISIKRVEGTDFAATGGEK